MSAEIVNLRKARKNKARSERDHEAERNRVAFGRTKAERRLANATRELQEQQLNRAKLAEPPSQGPATTRKPD
ncbi:MAG: DUF4169 family protein [Hyphomicrobiaceae bacterium]